MTLADKKIEEFEKRFCEEVSEINGTVYHGTAIKNQASFAITDWLRKALVEAEKIKAMQVLDSFKDVTLRLSSDNCDLGFHLVGKLVEGWTDILRLGNDVNHNLSEVEQELKELEAEKCK